MKIRSIDLNDLLLIKSEYIKYFNEDEDASWEDATLVRKFMQLTGRYDYLGLGLFNEQQMIGFAVGSLSQFDDGIIAILNEIFIIKTFQSKGLGTKLIKAFEREAKVKGAFRIQLECTNDDIHRHFYNTLNDYKDASNIISKTKAL